MTKFVYFTVATLATTALAGSLQDVCKTAENPDGSCKPGFNPLNKYFRRKIIESLENDQENRQRNGIHQNPIDQMADDGLKWCTENCNCALDLYLANHKIGLNADKARSNDLNCHDDECDIPVTLKGIWNYGCWCNFGGDLLKGKGTPVNPHDKVCQDMQLCLRCAEMDANDGGYACDAKTQSYEAAMIAGPHNLADNPDSINTGCTAINSSNKCAAHICTCETQMVNDLLALVWQGYTHDSVPRHVDNPFGGSFDWEAQCNTDPTGVIVKECCGKYPFRFPYNTVNKDCCENGGEYRTYNPLDQQCCASGVKKVGEAC